MSQYFCGTDCVVYLKLNERPPVLIENAYMIQYQQESVKHPLFGFRDTEFRAVAKGRTIVHGMLTLNREFKNELTYALLEKELDKLKDDTRLIGRRNGIGPKLGRFTPVALLQSIVDAANDLVQNAHATLAQLEVGYANLEKAAKVAFVQQAIIPSRTLVSIADYKSEIRKLTASVQDQLDSPGLNGDSGQKTQALIEELQIGSSRFADTLKNTYWSSDRELKMEDAMATPDSSFVFEHLNASGTIVDLEIRFGRPDEASRQSDTYADHVETIRSVYFEGASSRMSIDDRDPNKISYPFLGKTLNKVEFPARLPV